MNQRQPYPSRGQEQEHVANLEPLITSFARWTLIHALENSRSMKAWIGMGPFLANARRGAFAQIISPSQDPPRRRAKMAKQRT